MQASRTRLRRRFVEAYRKNYRPRRPPTLVLPTAPTDEDKYSYIGMKRVFMVTCGTIALLILAVGGWMFVKADPIYSWYAVYVFVSQFYVFASIFITVVGKPFDLPRHKRLVEGFPQDSDRAPTVDIYLPVCNEPLGLLENTWRYIAQTGVPRFKAITEEGRDENLRHAFTQTSGEFYTVFDADFCPRSDFLTPYIVKDEKRAILGTPQSFRSTGDQTWIEQGAGPALEYYYQVLQPVPQQMGRRHVRRQQRHITAHRPRDRGWDPPARKLRGYPHRPRYAPRAYFSKQIPPALQQHVPMSQQGNSGRAPFSAKQKLCYYYIGSIGFARTAASTFLSPSSRSAHSAVQTRFV
ncbi:MAG: hypothetical protein L6R39_000558 [Caloplaca ligustica]|nr:MAG: hypothetical protein L6R39_000558 [Caloplaca ligustica]